MKGDWDKDPAFKNLSDNKGISLRRLSYACFSLNCIDCDGIIHYMLKKEIHGFKGEIVNGILESRWHGQVRNAQTGEMEGEPEYEVVMWDTEMESVQLDGGQSQNPQNTPEGSKCECHHCHGRPGYDEWKARGGKPKEGFEPTRGFDKKEYAPGNEPPK